MLKKGDIVRVEREENEYEGFAWCENGGEFGWVTFESFEILDDIRGRMKEDYTSRELELSVGDEVRGFKIVSGLVWAKGWDGRGRGGAVELY